MSILFYKRPNYVAKGDGPMTAKSCQVYAEKASGSSIPDSLSFDKVIQNKTMPPCSLQDFLDYLVYVAHDAENLQFYLWVQDYKKRFSILPASHRALSPIWRMEDTIPDLRRPGANSVRSTPSDILDKDIEAQYLANLQKMADRKDSVAPTPPSKDDYDSASPPLSATLTQSTMSQMNLAAERRWKSFSSQPFRSEINQIITHYLLPSSARELNLSHKARANLLHALHRTTHPSALASIEDITLTTLRHHAHPNFIRWSLCNGNRPRVYFLRSLAVSWLILFVLSTLALILSSKPRWFRIALAPLLWVGVTNLIAAAKGLCVLLYRLHTREVRPWELDSTSSFELDADARGFADELAKGHQGTSRASSEAELVPQAPPSFKEFDGARSSIEQIDLEARPREPMNSLSLRLSPLGPQNKFEDEAWVERWRRMTYWDRIRVRKVWMKEEGLRLMQNKIVVQAELWALMCTILVEVGVVACPVVGLY